MIRLLTMVILAAALTSGAHAQTFHLSLRGGAGIPTGDFAEENAATAADAFLANAKTGFGYGVDAGVGLGMIGIYAGFDQIDFKCESATCSGGGKKFELSGVSAGVRVRLPGALFVSPWAKAGVTFNKLEGDYGASDAENLRTDRAPGYEVGAGLDIPMLGLFSLTPQVRYVGQNFKYRVPGVATPTTNEKGVNYFTAEIGFGFRTPF